MVDRHEKGHRAEAEVCEILRRYWGGEPWQANGKFLRGPDIMTPEDFPFDVEVKDHAVAKIRWLFDFGATITGFWHQAVVNASKKPMLCVRAEGVWFCIIREADRACIRNVATLLLVGKQKDDGRLMVFRLKDLLSERRRDYRDGYPSATWLRYSRTRAERRREEMRS